MLVVMSETPVSSQEAAAAAGPKGSASPRGQTGSEGLPPVGPAGLPTFQISH